MRRCDRSTLWDFTSSSGNAPRIPKYWVLDNAWFLMGALQVEGTLEETER